MDIAIRYVPTDRANYQGRSVLAGNKPGLCVVGKTEARCIVNNEERVEVVRFGRNDILRSPIVKGYEVINEGVPRFIAFVNVVLKKEKEVTPEVFQLMNFAQNPGEDFPSDEEPEEALVAKVKAKEKEKTPAVPKSTIIGDIAKEKGLEPSKIRKFLRTQGMKAPYEDVKAIKKLMKKYLE